MMQLTNIRYHDNGSPQADAPDFIRRFNEGNASTGGVKLRIGTLSEFFDRMRKEPAETLPTMRGDWTDWWNFGAGSTAHETAQTLRGQRDLDAALEPRGLAPRGQADAAAPCCTTRPATASRSTPSTPGAPTARSATPTRPRRAPSNC